MKLVVVKVGKPATKEIPALVSEYVKRCRAFGPIESLEVKDLKSLPRSAGKSHPLCGPGDKLVALDERGERDHGVQPGQNEKSMRFQSA